MSRSVESLDVKELKDLVNDILDKKNGVDDRDWCDIVAEYDLDLHPTTLRKAGVGVKMVQDAGLIAASAGEENPSSATDIKERQKLYDLQRNIRKDLREQSRSELLRETIANAIRDLPEIKLPEVAVQNNSEADTDLIVGIGDFHYGANYTVNGLYGEEINVYNSEVFERRMAELAARVANIANRNHPGRITVMIVGDMLDGLLRASQISRLEYGVVESAIRLSEFLCQWLSKLYSMAQTRIRVFAVRGNHGEIRPLGSRAGQFPEENMERVVMHYVAKRFNDTAIHVMCDDAPMYQMADVCGYNVLLVHGQGDDMEKIARDHQLLYNSRIDMFMCGHLHKSQTFTAGMSRQGTVLIERVPSICGIDPYAQSCGYGSPPGATVILMERGYGRRCVYPIILD